ncbi:MAG: rRNA maturation RNase YbeY [Parachlamydiaceae bacterium]
MKISIYNRQKDLKISKVSAKKAFISAANLYGTLFDEAAVHFVSEKELCQLHEQFFNDPSPTDCITFPVDSEDTPGYRFLGEVFVSPKAALEIVEASGGDPYEETTLYMIHGLLHLLGYNDIKKDDIVEMRKEESKIMNHLKNEGLCLK